MKRQVMMGSCFLGFVLFVGCGSSGSEAPSVTASRAMSSSSPAEVAPVPQYATATATSTGTTGTAAATRDIVRDAAVHLRARRPEAVLEAARRYIEAREGFVDSSNTVGTGAAISSHATFRIATERYAEALVHLRRLGEVLEVNEHGEDVTAQRADADARLVAKRQLETRLLGLTEHAGSVAELIQVENELGRVRGDIESMEAIQRGLEGRIAYATIRLDVDAPEQPMVASVESPLSKMQNAVQQGRRFAIGMIAATIALVTATSPFWSVGIVIWLVRRRTTRRLATV